MQLLPLSQVLLLQLLLGRVHLFQHSFDKDIAILMVFWDIFGVFTIHDKHIVKHHPKTGLTFPKCKELLKLTRPENEKFIYCFWTIYNTIHTKQPIKFSKCHLFLEDSHRSSPVHTMLCDILCGPIIAEDRHYFLRALTSTCMIPLLCLVLQLQMCLI